MTRRLLVVGAGKTADVVLDMLQELGDHVPVALAVDPGFVPAEPHRTGLAVLELGEALRLFPPNEVSAFVALGYHGCNDLRAERIQSLAAAGYTLPSLISRRAYVACDIRVPTNALVMAGASVQAGATLGDGSFVFSNAVVGHHAMIGPCCWIASGAAIGGSARLGERCFVGLNATIGHEVELGRRCLIGGGALVTRSAADETVFVAPESERLRVDTTRFLAFTKLR